MAAELEHTTDPPDLVRMTERFLDGLEALYRSLAEKTNAPRVREVFERLHERTAHERSRLGWETRSATS